MNAFRKLAFGSAGLLWLTALPVTTFAQGSYPTKPIRLIVPFAPGASNDIIARLVGQKLSESMGQQFVVDNRAGAGGSLGADLVAKAEPNGYTLLLANPGPNINNPTLRKNNPYRFEDFDPIVFLGYAPLIIVANPDFPASNAKELLAHARKNPGKINWGSSGNATSLHVGLALFQSATGTSITHVPYKGTAPALVDVVGGQINAMYTTSISAEVHIKSGRLKVLGVAGPKRQDVLPDVPTLAEQGITGADAIVWFGLVAPVKTPRAVIDVLNREANLALAAADVRKRLDSLGLIVGGGSVKELDDFMKNEVSRLLKLVKLGALTRD
jgi:tripartite-type tricarboxylate transporter receptor subunit TctC